MNLDLIPNIRHTKSNNFFLIAGPCAVESEQLLMDVAGHVGELCDKYEIPYIIKSSYKKANRSRIDSFTGIGKIESLEILQRTASHYKLPVLTDIHTEEEARLAANYVDVLQIPAFLCRQTDLLVAAAETGKVVNIKKGQFLSPEAMQFAVKKVTDSGNNQVLITERGTTFGFHDLVVDFRGIPAMRNYAPVVLDVTHSLQQPNQPSGVTGGRPDLIETIAKAGIVTGCDGLFIETHPEPSKALSDGANMLKLDKLDELLEKLTKVRRAIL